MIRIGPAGIPLSCKGRTNKDGIIYTHRNLDLNAIEIQFVRGLYVMSDEEAQIIRECSKENDIEVHVHAPYYINLAGDRRGVEDTGSTCLGTFADPMANAVVSWYLK